MVLDCPREDVLGDGVAIRPRSDNLLLVTVVGPIPVGDGKDLLLVEVKDDNLALKFENRFIPPVADVRRSVDTFSSWASFPSTFPMPD